MFLDESTSHYSFIRRRWFSYLGQVRDIYNGLQDFTVLQRLPFTKQDERKSEIPAGTSKLKYDFHFLVMRFPPIW